MSWVPLTALVGWVITFVCTWFALRPVDDVLDEPDWDVHKVLVLSLVTASLWPISWAIFVKDVISVYVAPFVRELRVFLFVLRTKRIMKRVRSMPREDRRGFVGGLVLQDLSDINRLRRIKRQTGAC